MNTLKPLTPLTFGKKAVENFIILFVVFLLFGNTSFAQGTTKYAFFTSNNASLALDRWGNAINMSSGTTSLVGASSDDGRSSVTNIGFTFPFQGGNQTQFSASSNGIIRLGATQIGTTQYSFPSGTQLLIAPYAGDLSTSSSGKVHYKVFGTAPNRVLVVEFLNMEINYSSSSANGTFQARLYESGIIEFVYGNMAVGGTTNNTTRIGFSNNTSTDNVISVNQNTYATSTNSTVITNTNSSTGVIAGLNSSANGSRRNFTFIPYGYQSQIVSITYGAGTWCEGEPRNVTVVIKNIGNDSWSDEGKDINIGLKWNVDGDYGGAPSFITRQDAAGLLPDATGTYVFPNVIPPAGATIENLTADVVYEQVSWFGNNNAFVGPGNTVLKTANITVSPLPTAVTVSGGGAGCVSKTITASGGTGGTIYFQGTTSGGTSTSVASSSQSVTSSGTYYFRSRSAAGCWGPEGSAVVTINTPPAIISSPISQTKCAGSSVTFTSTATGSNLTYQWRKNGANISGATSNSYTISSVATTDAGSYDVVASSVGCTSATSTAATLTVNTAPLITTAPQAQTLCEGSNATFTVAASGTPTPTYQWLKDGVNIAGSTSSTLSLSAITSANAGSYSVSITNSCSTIVSTPVALNVNTAPAITSSPISQIKCVGSSVTFTSSATGTNLTYQWRKNGANISGATNNNYTISSVAATDAGSYDVVVSNTGCTSATSTAATLTVNTAPVITTAPQAQTLCEGATATFTVAASGTPTPTYQWMKGGVNIAGATSSTLSLSAITSANAGSYSVSITNSCSTIVSTPVALNVNTAPSITTNPVSEIRCAGSSVIFTSSATGTNLTYQWRKNGANISGAINNNYTISSVATTDAGNYDVVVSNTGCTSATSTAATLTVNTAPVITTAPQAQTLCEGSTATFTVAASGTPAPTYQWMKGGVDITGATSSTLSLNSISPSDAGNYSVRVSNICSTITSANANLTVNIPPTFNSEPNNQTVCAGGSFSLSANASGSNVTYQWRKGGVNISGATSSVYTVPSAALTNAGNYDVVVSVLNCSSITSSTAVVTVNARPTAVITSSSNTICSQSSTTVSGNVNASGAWTLTLSDGQQTSGTGPSNFSIAVNPANTTTYTITSLFDNLCTSIGSDLTGSATITTQPLPTGISVTPALQTICNGGSANLSATGNISQAGVAFGENFNSTQTFTAAGTSSGNRSQIWTRETSGSNVNSNGAYTSTDGGNIMIAMSSATAIFGSSTSAVNSTLTSPSINTNSFTSLTLSFQHTFNKANTSSSALVEVSNNGTTWTSVKSYTTNVGGATNFLQESIAIPSQFLNQNLFIRFNYSAQGTSSFFGSHNYWWAIDAVSLNGNLVPFYSWTASTGTGINGLPAGAGTPSVNNKNITVSPSLSTDYTLTVTNPVTGCSSNSVSSVHVNARPTGIIGGSYTYCRGENTTSTLTLTVTGSGTISGTLSDGSVFSGTAPQILVNVNPTNSTAYTISTLTDVNCTSIAADLSGIANVTVNERPTGVLSGDASYCIGSPTTTQLSIAVTGTGTISGTLSDGTAFSGSAPLINVSVSPVATTTYTIATMSDASCISNTSDFSGSATVTINPLIPVSVSIVSSDDDNTICDGSSVNFTATPVNGGNAHYQWLLNGNAVGNDQNTFTASTLINGDVVTVQLTSDVTPCAINNPAISNAITTVVNANQPVSVSITSSDNDNIICDGTSVTFTASAQNEGPNPVYEWMVNGIAAGTNQSTFTTSTLSNNDVVTVRLTSDITPCAITNPATSNAITTVVNANQPVSITISTATPLSCSGKPVLFTSEIINGGNNPAYQWYLNGAAITDSVSSTITLSTLIDGDVITASLTSNISPCATGNPATSNSITMSIGEIPQTPGPITGPTDVCPFADTNIPITYSIEPVLGATSYTWRVPVGATIVSGQGTTSISVLIDNSFALTNSRFKVVANNEFPCSSERSFLDVLKIIPGIPTNISGPVNVCEYVGTSNIVTYSIEAVEYATSYTWTPSENITIIDGQGTTTLRVKFNLGFVIGSIKVAANSNCGTRAPKSMNISAVKAQAPGLISGPVNACPFIGQQGGGTYSIGAVQNATSYLWTAPAGCTILSGQGTNSIVLGFSSGYQTGILKVRSVTNCNSSGDRTLKITNAIYSAPGAISGPENACMYLGTSQIATYSISKVENAPAYLWTVPAGCTIVGHPGGAGQNDTIINVTFSSNYINGGLISVKATGCITTEASNLTIYREPGSGIPSLITGPTNVCEYIISENNQGFATYYIRKTKTATNYIWSTTGGATIISHPGGTGFNDTIVNVKFNSGFDYGSISVSSSNGCGFSEPRILKLNTLKPVTPGAILSTPNQTCPTREFTYYLAEVPTGSTSLEWTVPNGGTIISGQGTISILVAYSMNSVSGNVTVTPHNNCSQGSTRSLKISLAGCAPGFAGKTEIKNESAFEGLNISVYPNPSNFDFKLKIKSTDNEKAYVKILDILGREILKGEFSPEEIFSFGSNLKKGVYFVEVRQGKLKTTTKIIRL